MKKCYLLRGIVKVRNLYGYIGWGSVNEEVDDKRLEELKKINFLDDYLEYGGVEVEYVDLYVLPVVELEENGDYVVRYLHSQAWYETHGELTKKEAKELEKIYPELMVN
jgi:hypothetical protein